uniref:Death domain-containing protein n=1 Tax=Amphimedon queenslandica TaxID=400682 RepID=A0A1X7SQT6_AMPQE
MASMVQSFENVCSKVLCIDDLNVIYNKVKAIAARWKQFANSLYIRPATISIIEADCGSSSESCLHKVLEHWLKKDYNYESFGSPCWRRVCVAVKEGGGDPALAQDIAREHPLSASTGGESTADSIYALPVKDVRLLNEIYNFQWDFSDILNETRDAFKPKLLSKVIDYLKTRVHALLGPNKNNEAAMQGIKEELCDIESIEDLFMVLQQKYVSWFNYELIVKLVIVFLPNNRSLKKKWSGYEEKLKDYFLNSDGLLIDANALEFGIRDVPPGTKVMIAKVDRDDYTPADLFFFRRAIPKELNIPDVNLYFSFVRIGSLQLLHNIPDYLYSALFPLSTEIQQQLASIGITELTCGDYQYDLRKFSASQELQQSVQSSLDIGM